MKRRLAIFLVVAYSLATAHWLPAPIVESEEKPTPAAEEPAKPKVKRTSRPKSSSNDSSENSGTHQARAATAAPTPPQNPFEGTWAGTLNNLPFTGDVQFTLAVTAGGTAVTENSINFGTHSFQVNCDGTTMKWETGSSWTLTPTADRSTALVTCSNPGFFGFGAFSLSTVFRRIAAAPQTTPQTTTATIAARPNDKRNSLPTAKPVPGKPGFVYNPFDTNSKILLDVRGKASGAKVKDPFSGQLFIVP